MARADYAGCQWALLTALLFFTLNCFAIPPESSRTIPKPSYRQIVHVAAERARVTSENTASANSLQQVVEDVDPGKVVLSVGATVVPVGESVDVVLQLKDTLGNNVTSEESRIVFSSTLGQVSPMFTSKGDGRYETIYSGITTGMDTIEVYIDGVRTDASAEIELLPAQPSSFNSTLALSDVTVTASETVLVTVRLKDFFGNSLVSGGDDVLIYSSFGTVSEIVDHGEGTYTSILSADREGTALISFSVNGSSSSSILRVQFLIAPVELDNVSLKAAGNSTQAGNPVTVWVQLKDKNNRDTTAEDAVVTLLASRGQVVSPAIHVGDGRYESEYSSDIPGSAVIQAFVDKVQLKEDLDIQVVSGPAAAEETLLTLSDSAPKTGDSVELRVQLFDVYGNPVLIGGDTVVIGSTAGASNEAVDNADGTYTTVYTAPEKQGENATAVISAWVNGVSAAEAVLSLRMNPLGDEDDDGISNGEEGEATDSDQDGIADFRDQDSDNDSVPDAVEGSGDVDADGIANYLDDDSDGDGYSDELEANHGTDFTDPESLPDDVDSDGDSIADGLERGHDTDGDLIPDHLELDSDNDGIFDLYEAYVDTDMARQLDQNQDGKVDAGSILSDDNLVFDAVDTDADGIDDYRDLDSDDDGIWDSVEYDPGQDPVLLRNTTASSSQMVQTRVLHRSDYHDADSDGIENHRDLDSDNDTIADLVEAGGIDSNNDGRWNDSLSADSSAWVEGYQVLTLPYPDTDADGVQDFLDLDSDQDGLSDLLETGVYDADADGRVDDFVDLNGDGVSDVGAGLSANLPDTDGDRVRNSLDLDSDGDGLSDLLESGRQDDDEDGRLDTARDTDADGIPNNVDVDATAGEDANNNGLDDRFDSSFVNAADTDEDGIVDAFDTDVDGNGFFEVISEGEPALGTALPDTDMDGEPDITDKLTTNQQLDDGQSAQPGALASGSSGMSGGGCSIRSSSPGFDVTLSMLLILAGLRIMKNNAGKIFILRN